LPITGFTDENEARALDKYHTHFLLLDDGSIGTFLDDNPRSDFVQAMYDQWKCPTITIIVEGGPNSLQTIKNDLDSKRPVLIVHGSGRLADTLGNLLIAAGKNDKIE
jgi:hypothetical protein